ncbi:MAG: hypothetical protein QFX40_00550 [Archaeoglobales archaeon]|nr:hypothetical protein [Archaeoglobales archaeon]
MMLKTYYLSLIIVIAIEVLVKMIEHHAPHFLWETIPGFHALFGFVGCIFLVYASKSLGHKILMKDPEYYERRGK